jgi:hypothetical protein
MSNEQRYFDALNSIAKKYQTAAQIRKRAGQYGCSHVEELEMIYENVQAAAREAIRGRRRPKE